MPCKLAITSMSLGRCQAGHSLIHKLDMAHRHGYRGIELFHDDLASLAADLPGVVSPAADRELAAAVLIRQLCADRGLTIICLQPFLHYEGLADRGEHGRRLAQLTRWFELARALGTDMIQIPSSFLAAPALSPSRALAVADLRRAADMGLAQAPAAAAVRFAYEALCWGTRCDTWEAAWEVVRAVDRPNFGLCLDTFHVAGRAWADPCAPGGRRPDADAALRASLDRLRDPRCFDPRKLFYVQVVDAERPGPALLVADPPSHHHHHHQPPPPPPRMTWSRNCRLFYGESERGAYLPVARVAEVIFRDLGYEGWVSMELFHARMADPDPDVPRELAARGAAAWAKLVRDMGLRVEEAPKVKAPAESRVTASL
ncbi:xylose isomerase-like protein [Biscogniauxia mediterranea]|nr:xylose isomerase-like protein [Biscogniauxia mediterranea]